MDPKSEAMEAARAKAALRKTEAEIRSLEVNALIAARRLWLDVGKFTIIAVPLAAGALKFLGTWL